MNERIKQLRKSLKMSQEQFGERLGIKKSSLSLVENGRNNVSDQLFRSICREFQINEEWLRNGTGPMKRSQQDMTLDEYLKSRDISESEMEILRMYFELEPEFRHKLIEQLQKGFLSSLISQQNVFNSAESSNSQPPLLSPEDAKYYAGMADEKDNGSGVS